MRLIDRERLRGKQTHSSHNGANPDKDMASRECIFLPDSGTTFFDHLLSDKVARIHLTAEKNVRYGIELWSTELVNSVRE